MALIREWIETPQQRSLLTESVEGLSTTQIWVVENIYRSIARLNVICEEPMTPQQIQQLFGAVEQGLNAAGGNRKFLGKAADTASAVKAAIDQFGQELQNTTLVKNFDQRFEAIKQKAAAKFPKLANAFTSLGEYGKRNPVKTAAIIGLITGIAALSSGPVGAAIAGQVLRGSMELMKGSKLSTAVAKGAKTAAIGAVAGEIMGGGEADAADSVANAGDAEAAADAAQTVKPGQPVPLDAEDKSMLNQLAQTGPAGLDMHADYLAQMVAQNKMTAMTAAKQLVWTTVVDGVQSGQINSAGDLRATMQDAMDALRASLGEEGITIDKEGWKNISMAKRSIESHIGKLTTHYFGQDGNWTGSEAQRFKQFRQLVATGKVAIKPLNTESVKVADVDRLFEEVQALHEQYLIEAGIFKRALGAVAGSVANTAKKVFTTKTTAGDLKAAWKKARRPTDSKKIKSLLQIMGIPDSVIDQAFSSISVKTEEIQEPIYEEVSMSPQQIQAAIEQAKESGNREEMKRLQDQLQQMLDADSVEEMAIDRMKVGDKSIEWSDEGEDLHMIKDTEGTKIHAIGNRKEIAAKWAKIKQSRGVTEVASLENTPKKKTDYDGTQTWWLNGKLHRDDGPAMIYKNGTRKWVKDGKLHRDDGPAVVDADGSQIWYLNGQRHRDDGPAVVNSDGTRMWYKAGKLHREDGPAFITPDGKQTWFQNGVPSRTEKSKKVTENAQQFEIEYEISEPSGEKSSGKTKYKGVDQNAAKQRFMDDNKGKNVTVKSVKMVTEAKAPKIPFDDYGDWRQSVSKHGAEIYAMGAASGKFEARSSSGVVGEFDKSSSSGWLYQNAKPVTEEQIQEKSMGRKIFTDIDQWIDYVENAGAYIRSHGYGKNVHLAITDAGFVGEFDADSNEGWAYEAIWKDTAMESYAHAINKSLGM